MRREAIPFALHPKINMPNNEFLILQMPRVSPQTGAVLEDRVRASQEGQKFFGAEEFRTLEKLVACVLPQANVGTNVNVARAMDQRLQRGESAGWRFATLPPDPDVYRMALSVFSKLISDLGSYESGSFLGLLDAVQQKQYDTTEFTLSRWFENFKTEAVRCWLADPQTMARMGYEGFADELLQPQIPGSTR